MSKTLSPDTPLNQPGSTVDELEVRIITLYEAVGAFLLRIAPIIQELKKYEVPSNLLEILKQEWIDLDLVHRRTGIKD